MKLIVNEIEKPQYRAHININTVYINVRECNKGILQLVDNICGELSKPECAHAATLPFFFPPGIGNLYCSSSC